MTFTMNLSNKTLSQNARSKIRAFHHVQQGKVTPSLLHPAFFFKRFILVLPLIVLGFQTAPGSAQARAMASLPSVDVTVHVAPKGHSRIITKAKFFINDRNWKGFNLDNLKGATLVKEECKASYQNGKSLPISFISLPDGQTRVGLKKQAKLKRGSITFLLVHEIDFILQGNLRLYEGKARFNWTPLTWDESLSTMEVHIVLPGKSKKTPITPFEAVTREYEVVVFENWIDLTKHRPSRWYPMQVMIDFDSSLIKVLSPMAKEDKPRPIAAASMFKMPKETSTLWYYIALFTGLVLTGFFSVVRKATPVRKVNRLTRQTALKPVLEAFWDLSKLSCISF